MPPGRVLLVSNHSGQFPIDGMLLGAAMFLDAEPPRIMRSMVEKWTQTLPFVGTTFARVGQVLNDLENGQDRTQGNEQVRQHQAQHPHQAGQGPGDAQFLVQPVDERPQQGQAQEALAQTGQALELARNIEVVGHRVQGLTDYLVGKLEGEVPPQRATRKRRSDSVGTPCFSR